MAVNLLLRYFHTLRHLKLEQIVWQVIYRLKKSPVLGEQTLPNVVTPLANPVLLPFLHEKASWLGNQSFTFLNLQHDFDSTINWDEDGYGKLWTYKLNYFEFLHQDGITKNEGLSLINDFIGKSSQLKTGLEPYPISLRGINWIKFLIKHSIKDNRIQESLFAQYMLLNKRLEFHLLGNHLLENAFSLLFAGIYFQEKKFVDTAVKLLRRELNEQILDDGAHFELSPMYHCILLQRVLDGINLLQSNEHLIPDIEQLLREIAFAMTNWLHAIRFSTGDLPMVNDAVHCEYPNPDKLIDYAANLGIQAKPSVLGDSGYRLLKTGLFECFADVGQIGPSYIPGHAHADSLQTLLYIDGKPILVDPAVSTYQKNSLRDEERGTWKHNTVTVNETNSSDVWGGFRVGKRAKTTILKDEPNWVIAAQDGYSKLNTEHQREWVIDDEKIVIRDSINSKTSVNSVASFHFHPDIQPEMQSQNSVQAGGIYFEFNNSTTLKIEDYAYNNGFNQHQTAAVVRVPFIDKLETSINIVT
jgi:hypothetical protein